MKRRLAMILATIILALAMSGAAAAQGDARVYIPGTYRASAYGMNGQVEVTMTFDENDILQVEVQGSQETPGISSMAIERLPGQMLTDQSAQVDAVAGATITSNAILEAAALCVAQAQGQQIGQTADEAILTADVIVVGAGGAGLAAAAAAGEMGAQVIVLEASGRAGGATLISGGHMSMLDQAINASMPRNDEKLRAYLDYLPSKYYAFGDTLVTLKGQIEQYLAADAAGRFDSVERMIVDQFTDGTKKDLDGVPAFVDFNLIVPALGANMDVLAWLCDEGGMAVQSTVYKEHGNTPEGKGLGVIQALINLVDKAGASIAYNTRATELVMEGNRVAGVRAIAADGSLVTYSARRGVVLATGSFAANSQMCAQYQRMGTGMTADNPSDNVPTATGDGILMAQSLGAKLRDMQFVNLILLGYDNGCTATEMPKIDGKHQLIVNAQAQRFGNDQNSSTISAAAANQYGGLAYLVGDKEMYDAIEAAQAGLTAELAARGWFYVADTLSQAAEAAGLNAQALTATVNAFNGYVEQGVDPQYGRAQFNGKVEQAPFIVAKMQMHYHLTLGGLVIDSDARVYDEQKQPIPCLYAAGDVVSGIEGATHQSGSNLTAVIYYGKVAGQNSYAMADAEIPKKVVKAEKSIAPSTLVEMEPEALRLAGPMVRIPGGTFTMGTPEDEPFRDDLESPLHQVTVNSFEVGQYGVTIGQYRAFCEATNRPMPQDLGKTSFDGSPEWSFVGTWADPFPGGYPVDDSHPVTCVTWYDAMDFCAWLSRETGEQYRLLTEAEYEYACRAGTDTPYYTGDKVTKGQANFGRYYGSRTLPVGSFPANPWGLYDMMGNVWCWLADDFADQDYQGAPQDGSAWVIEGAAKKAVRGASWNVDGQYLRSGNRDGYAPDVRYSRLGFRIARSIEQ